LCHVHAKYYALYVHYAYAREYHPTQHNGPTTHQCINIAYTVRRALVRLGGGGPRRKSEFAQRICNNYNNTELDRFFFKLFSCVCVHNAHTHTLFDERLPSGTSPTSFPTRHIMLVRREKLSPSYYFSCFCLRCCRHRRRAVKSRDGRLVFHIR